jgi:hypothetical protein
MDKVLFILAVMAIALVTMILAYRVPTLHRIVFGRHSAMSSLPGPMGGKA